MNRALLIFAALAFVLFFRIPSARGEHNNRPCPSETIAWATQCATRESLTLTPRNCPDRRAVFMLQLQDKSMVQVEVSSEHKGMRSVRDLGISPVAQFDDWNQAPAPLRDAFDRFVRCVETDATLKVGSEDVASQPHWQGPEVGQGVTDVAQEGRAGTASIPMARPWRLIVAALAMLAMLAMWLAQQPRRHLVRSLTHTGLPLVMLYLATWLVRHFAVVSGYFHQNGQGPLWIDYALGLRSPYGMGYRETFGLFASRAQDPDNAVFLVQSFLAASVPVCAWIISRRAGASRLLSWAFALIVLCDPVLARGSRTETYFATCISLTFIASAILAMGTASTKGRSIEFMLSVLCAGMLLSQSARIHPLGWVPTGLVPLVALAGPGRLRRRLLLTVFAYISVGLIVALFTLPSMLEVLHGELGRTWMAPEHADPPWHHLASLAKWIVPAGVVLIASSPSRNRWRVALYVVVLMAVVFVGVFANKLGVFPDWFGLSYGWLHAPAVLACTVAIFTRIERTRWHRPATIILVLMAGVPFGLVRWKSLNAPTTDQEELGAARTWRTMVPARGVVVFLGEAGRRRLFLPLYAHARKRHALSMTMSTDDLSQGLTIPWPDTFYYHSSLCSSAEGTDACDVFERTHKLEQIGAWTVGSNPSMPGLGYTSSTVETKLYRLAQ